VRDSPKFFNYRRSTKKVDVEKENLIGFVIDLSFFSRAIFFVMLYKKPTVSAAHAL
jgi:hypothetical protein